MDCDGVAAGEKMLVFVFSANACCAPDTAKIAAALSMRRGKNAKAIACTNAPDRAITFSIAQSCLRLAPISLTHRSARQRMRTIARRWNIAFLLGFGVLINFFDRVNLSVHMMRCAPRFTSMRSRSAILRAYN